MSYMYDIHLYTYIQELNDLIEMLYIGLKFKSKEAIQVSSCVCMYIIHQIIVTLYIINTT